MFKRMYHILAWLALANLFAVGGLVGYLFASGRLNAERIEQIAVVLRGEFPQPQVQATQPEAVVEKPQTSREELARLEAKRRIYALIAERQQREIEDRNKLSESIKFDVNRQLEQIESKAQEFTQQKEQAQKVAEQSGFQETLDIFSEMDPKIAKDILRTHCKDADAVRMLMQMDSGRRKKIVNGCKTPEEKEWMSRLLAQMQGMDSAETGTAAANNANRNKSPG